MLWSNKAQPSLVAKGRKRQRQDSKGSGEEGDSEGSGGEGVEGSTEVSTPVSQDSRGRGRRRRSTKTPRKSLPSDKIPRQLGRLVDILEAKTVKSTALDSVDELKAEFSSLKEQMNSLEAGISNILSILSRNQ
jgi:hypothetical protein